MNATEVNIPVLEVVIEATVLICISLTSLVGNISLWIIVTGSKSLRSTSNALVLCLSTADLLVSGVNMPVTVWTLVSGTWPLSDDACTIFGFISMLTFVASVMSLGTISLNRYFMICHPNKFRQLYNKRNTAFFIMGTWILSACLALPPLVGWGQYGFLPGQSFCFCQWTSSISYTIFMVCVCFGGPCSVMTFCYVRILQEVRASKRRVQAGGGDGASTLGSTLSQDDMQIREAPLPDKNQNGIKRSSSHNSNASQDEKGGVVIRGNPLNSPRMTGAENGWENGELSRGNPGVNATDSFNSGTAEKNKHKKKKRKSVDILEDPALVAQRRYQEEMRNRARAKRRKRRKEELRLTLSFLVVIVCFIICWMPFCITMFISVFAPPVPRIPDMATLLLGCFNSCCNPVIYGIMNRKFRAGFQSLYCSACQKPANQNSSLESGSRSNTHQQTNTS